MDITLKYAKKTNNYNITMKSLTHGQVLALTGALVEYAEHSPVADDLLDGLRHAVSSATQLPATLVQDLEERYAPPPPPPTISVVPREAVTAEALRSVADKFEVARWGDGPGISADDLASIGIVQSKNMDWEDFCALVYKAFSSEPFPGSQAHGRGFRSQQCGEHVVKLLQKIADEKSAPKTEPTPVVG